MNYAPLSSGHFFPVPRVVVNTGLTVFSLLKKHFVCLIIESNSYVKGNVPGEVFEWQSNFSTWNSVCLHGVDTLEEKFLLVPNDVHVVTWHPHDRCRRSVGETFLPHQLSALLVFQEDDSFAGKVLAEDDKIFHLENEMMMCSCQVLSNDVSPVFEFNFFETNVTPLVQSCY